MTKRSPKIIIVGPAYVEMSVKCDSCPEPGQILEGTGFSCTPTGPGVNRAIQAALCGCEVFLLARVGEDCFGDMIKQNLSRYGVSTDLVYASHAISTGIILTLVDSRGTNRSCQSEGANKVFGRDEIEYAAAEQAIGSANVCLIHDGLSQEAVVSAIRSAQIHKTRTVLEVSLPVPERGVVQTPNWPVEYYNADILILRFPGLFCRSELGAGRDQDLRLTATDLVAKGASSVVISMGSYGTLLTDRQGTQTIRGIQTEMVDHTGCEDAFGGALAACFGTGDSPASAVRFAVAAEALTRSRFGLQDALPVKEEIITLLQEQPD
ncbi:MAG TPA: PfkB family carbohydrate kinase [Anaerohalosphaeraceae bacterium]|jgi:ribokinase|nr:PfkB family carbohydrate kinase [Anaerohalosphaeraceae bacterium]